MKRRSVMICKVCRLSSADISKPCIPLNSPSRWSVILCCNDEGKLNGMQPNRRLGDDIICGPFFLVGDDHAGGFCSLTEEQIQRYTQVFQEPEQFTGQEPELKPYMELYMW